MRPGLAFQRKLTLGMTAVSWPSVAVVVLYLLALLRLPPAHQRVFYETAAAAVLLLGPLLTWMYQRLYAPIGERLDRREQGRASDEDLREAFRRVNELPLRVAAAGVGCWVASATLVVGAMTARAHGLSALTAFSMFMGLVSGGMVSVAFSFFVAKRLAEPERLSLAAAIGAPDLREPLVRTVLLARKLHVTVIGVTLLTVVFAALLAVVSAGRSVEVHVAALQQRLLERADAAAGSPGLAALGAEARRSGVADELLLLDPDTLEARLGDAGLLDPVERDAIARSGDEAGDSSGFQSSHDLAWRRLPGGAGVVVAVSSSRGLAGEQRRVRTIFAVVLVVSGLVAWGVAWMLSDDVGRATAALRRQAEGIAAGDLRGEDVFDAEDELGVLARAFDRMRVALRAMVGGVADTANGVEAAAGEIAGAAGSVGQATADQVQSIRSASESMDRINVGVKGIASSAQALSHAVDDTSSSVHQLGAVGDELNLTAAALSAKVDTVSSAVEEIAASIREVARSADALAVASVETSSSMEEMACSVREVESNAAETARLSGRVVGAADRGRERVAQTIAGMATIQRETEMARRVIGTLGARASEIGGILEVINDVADETNLLALNAAIISAQAGESGRAFSVVADQIKALARRVLASTREIEERVRAVQQETANAVAAIERGARSVASGVELSVDAGRSLDEITGAARESGDRIEEIVAAIREQAKAAVHVVGLMEQLQAGVERIRKASQEQDRGNELILGEVVDMRNAAERVSTTTREQHAGAARIRGAFESVHQAVEQISAALQEQSEACARSAGLLDRMSDRTSSNEESVQRMSRATGDLLRGAEALRESVRRFRL